MATYALLVGIPTYNEDSGLQALEGATADVADVLTTLQSVVKEPVKHLSAPPPGHKYWTLEAIRAGFKWLEQAQPGDRVVVYFSGHGGRLDVPEGLGDGLEVIMPYDFRDKDDPYNVDSKGRFLGEYRNYFTDAELDQSIGRVVGAKKDMLVEVILDSCHSVGMGDADFQRGCFCAPSENAVHCALWAAALTRADYRKQDIGTGVKKKVAYRSSFTYEFCKAIRENPAISRRELLERIDDATQTYSRLECCDTFRDQLRKQPPFQWMPLSKKKKLLEMVA